MVRVFFKSLNFSFDMHRSKKKFIPLNVKWFTLICQMTRGLLNKLGNKIVNSSENSPLVVRLWCKKRIKKKKLMEILAMDGSLFHFLFEIVIRYSITRKNLSSFI